MAQDMIQAVRQAELSAEQIEKSAASESEVILKKAQMQTEQLIAYMTEEAKKQAEKALEDAKTKGEAMMKEALDSVNQELAVLQQNAKANEDKAVQAIMAELI